MIRRLFLLVLYIFIPLVVAAATYAGMVFVLTFPAAPGNRALELFQVSEQATLSGVAEELKKRGLLRFPWSLKLLAKMRNQDTAIKAGEYEFSASMTPAEILEKMVSGKMFLRKVTIREGMSVWEIGPLIEQAGILTRAEFEPVLTDPHALKVTGVDANSFEGYLFPETYQFPRGTSPRKILSTMVEQLKKTWKPEWHGRLRELDMNKHQLLTLASIIEKESGSTEEQPLISSVFHNRIKKKMRLQADPTVIYGIPNFNGNLTKDDLNTPTPYNTYVVDGLPPGPIANPGRTAIEAALFPAQSEYLYFVADGQGKHIFSESLDNHNQAVNDFQKTPQKAPQKSNSQTPKASNS